MSATEFEAHHQTLLHMFVVTLAFLTYLIVPDDVVWLLVRNLKHYRLAERSLFAFAALLIGLAAGICTWARAYPEPSPIGSSAPTAADGPFLYLWHPGYLGRLVYALGLGSLAPLPGFLILVLGEALLVFRLIRRTEETDDAEAYQQNSPHRPRFLPSFYPRLPARNIPPAWKKAFRQESGKWGLFFSMIVFTILLVDRVADILVVASLLLWLLLNPRVFSRSGEAS